MSQKIQAPIELQVIEQVNEGVSYREIGRRMEMSDSTVREIVKRNSVEPIDFIQKLTKSTGVAALKAAVVGFEELAHRLTNREPIQTAQLAVVAGIAASRGNELLSKPEEIAPPDYTKISDSIDKLFSSDSPLPQAQIIAEKEQAD